MSNYGTNPVRSPSYPSTNLADAIASVAKIYSKYRLAKVDRAVAAKLLGYSGMNGPAAKSQAALAHYGLVERAGKGELRVTERAKAILYPDSEEERLLGLHEAASEPSLFRELQERFPDMIPPADGVETYLHRKGFNQSAIRPATKAYLETMLYLEEAEGSESRGTGGENPRESVPSDEGKEIMTTATPASSVEIGKPILLASNAATAAVGFANSGPTLNKIGLNVQGHLVHVEALLDYEGLLALEKKIAGLKSIIDRPEEDEEEDVDGQAEHN